MNNITISDAVRYYRSKEEHYPITDDFVVKYRQPCRGYIETAKRLGIENPSQRFHILSYLVLSLEDGSLSSRDSITTCFNRIICPELLIYLAECCEIETSLVRQAAAKAETIIKSGVPYARNKAGREIKKLISPTMLEEAILREAA